MADDWSGDEDAASSLDHKSYDKILRERKTDGFRTGLSVGKEKTLQMGFNHGYIFTVDRAFQLATIRGKLVALLCFNLKNSTTKGTKSRKCESADVGDSSCGFNLTEEIVEEMERLVEDISSFEKTLQDVKLVEVNSGEGQSSDLSVNSDSVDKQITDKSLKDDETEKLSKSTDVDSGQIDKFIHSDDLEKLNELIVKGESLLESAGVK